MVNPRGPSGDDPSEGAGPRRPAGPPNRGAPPRRQPPPPSEYPTRQIRHGGRTPDPGIRDVPRPQQPGPPNRPPQQPGPPPQQPGRPQQPGLPPNAQPRQPGPPPPHPHEQATTRISTQPPSNDTPIAGKPGFFGNRTAILLILAIVVLLVLAGAIGAELYTRHLASSKVAQAVKCEVQDGASVSFVGSPPVLWQYLTRHYTDISVQTAGNQVRSAKGMKVSLDIKDVKLNNTNNSQGTIGSLSGTISWSADGIKQSIQDAIPVLGKFVSGEVTTNPGDGTVTLKGTFESATVKPQIVNNGLSLQIVSLTPLGSNVTTAVQRDLDDLTSTATQNYPLGIHADSVKVTSTGVEGSFSSSNATIPAGGSQDPCFANL
jgi:LmeA-like phospholipid-binding